MSLPVNVGSGTVTGRLIDSNGVAVEGKVTFTPSPAKLLNVGAEPTPVTILPKPVTVDLEEGSFTTPLVATDDPDNNPSGWTYSVAFALTGVKLAGFSIEVPEGATIDLTEVAPVATSGGVTITRGPAGDAGEPGPQGEPGEGVPAGGTSGQVLAKTSATDYDTAWVDQSGGGGGGAVDSVNGQTGAVTLDAADVGALPDSTTLFSGAYTDLTGTPVIPDSADDVGALPDTYAPTWAQVTGKPATFPPATHNHDDRYYTETEIDTALAGKADNAALFSGAYGDLTGTPTIPSTPGDIGAQPAGDYATSAELFSGAYADLTGTPTIPTTPGDIGALPDTYAPTLADIPAGSTLSVVYNGSSWPSRPTARTDVVVQWLDFTGTAPVPAGGIENLDLVFQDSGV